jgi:hypothetical protein
MTYIENLSSFDLKLSVTDQVFTSISRLHVQIKTNSEYYHLKTNTTTYTTITNHTIINQRPKFKSSILVLPMHQDNVFKLNLNTQLVTQSHPSQFTINSDESWTRMFKIENYNTLTYTPPITDSSLISTYYYLPIMACDRLETGLCDQMLLILNRTLTTPTPTRNMSQPKFAYNYWALTIQQTLPQHDTSSNKMRSIDIENNNYDDDEEEEEEEGVNEEDEDDYYIDENYESTERFYFDIKVDTDDHDINDENTENKIKYDFELTKCFFTKSQNVQILTQRMLKSMFTLNKHNGVLSSRKIINAIEPGTYDFDISLKASNDSMRLRLILIPPPPPSSSASSQSNILSYFKFDKEFYKFTYDESREFLGGVRLQNRFKSKKIMPKDYDVTFKLISNDHMFSIDKKSGKLYVNNNNNNSSDANVLGHLNEDMELTLYVLALVDLKNNANFTLEYMCEIQVDFKSYLNHSSSNRKFLVFGKKIPQSEQHLTLNVRQNYLDMIVYKFLAFMVNDKSNR